MCSHSRRVCWITAIMCVCALFLSTEESSDCDIFFNSTAPGTSSSEVFYSPGWPNAHYPLNRHCTFYFIGRIDQRVRINITHFQLQGVEPSCLFDYVDIYSQLTSLDPEAQLSSPLLGRFCGENINHLPRLIISTANIIIIDFYSDSYKTAKGFRGTYQFTDDSIYNFGKKTQGTLCTYTIYSSTIKTGFILSPTYPGIYPDNLQCSYRLVGNPGERIKIDFSDFSLFHGGEYCPYDSFTVYDGKDSNAVVLETFCGKHKNVTFFSTDEHLYITFITRTGRMGFANSPLDTNVDFQFDRRGFNVSYTFISGINLLDALTSQNVQHVKGTACDIRVFSNNQDNGTISSPGYPKDFPVNVTCHYYIDGLMTMKELQKVKVEFKDFSIPGNMPHCDSGFLAVSYEGKKYLGVNDERFCGTLLPPDLLSDGPRLVLIFDTTNARRGRGFTARYSFLPDFGIPGKPIKEGECMFLYDSTGDLLVGTFNSPRYPMRYGNNINCTYKFRPKKPEMVLISFYAFSVGNKYSETCINSDYLEIFQDKTTSNFSTKHCGNRFPGPILVKKTMEIGFQSRYNSLNRTGFEAKYEFVHQNKLNSKCGEKMIYSTGTGGLIKSPGYPEKYKSYTYCKWRIQASKPTNKILIQFDSFQIEGDLSGEDTKGGYGCVNAVVRLNPGPLQPPQPLQEKCGTLKKETFLSIGDTYELEFLTSSRALGGKGFRIIWTEVHYNGDTCYGFRCSKTNYCIKRELTCNQLRNCGGDDDSDETIGCKTSVAIQGSSDTSGPATANFNVLHIAIGASISSFFCIVLVFCGLYHRKKFRPEQTRRQYNDQDQVEVRYVAASSSCNTTDRLLTIDHTDENGHHTSKTTTPLHSPNQTPKITHNATVSTPNQTPKVTHNATVSTPNQTPIISTVNKSNHHTRTPRIQKVSIV